MELTSHSPAKVDFPTGRIRGPGAGPLELAAGAASYGAHGVGARMRFSVAPTPFGQILLAATSHGVSWLGIHDSVDYLEAELRADYPQAEVLRDDPATARWTAQVVACMTGTAAGLDLPMDIRGTPFQLQVWRALCAIPRGATRAYGELAAHLGRPAASRAVGHANGANPTAIIIPCHRVIGMDGALTGYRWGVAYKRRLLEHEGAFGQRSLDPAARAPA